MNDEKAASARQLLTVGWTNRAIAREPSTDAKAVGALRRSMGLPTHRFPIGLSLEDSWRARTEPGIDGHLLWAGTTTAQGSPVLRHRDNCYTAHRIAFKIRTGEWPVGTAKAECGVRLCVEPTHVDDTATRTRDRKALPAVLGRTPRVTHCVRGHNLAIHGSYRDDGIRWCRECKRVVRAERAAARSASTSTT